MLNRRSRLLRSCIALVAGLACLLAAPARADLVVPGSSYSLNILASSGNTAAGPISFDGLWESFARVTVDGNEIGLRINESQWDIGGGLRALEVIIMADGDIYPVAGESGYLNIGPDLFDLIGDVSVQSAIMSVFIDSVLLVEADMFAIFPSYFDEPWDGGFFDGSGVGWSNLGGRGVNEIRLLITTRDIAVPTPASVTLFGLGLLCLLVRRRGLAQT